MSLKSSQTEEPAGVRVWFHRHPKVTTGLTAVLVFVAIATIALQVLGSRKRYADHLPTAYFTTDDGKTYFVAGMENVPPFEHNGQMAVRAYVFRCGSAKPFVAYVERYVPEAHKAMVENRATPQHQIGGRELKRPGETAWVKSSNRKAAAAIADVRCPDGAEMEPLEP
jgi:hypothetical protein